MGMPGSETALEELLCRLLGDHIQAGFVSKLATICIAVGTKLMNSWKLDQGIY